MRVSGIKRTLVAAIASIAVTGVASAADMPVKALKAPPPVPVFSWTGCYVGANAGATWNHAGVTSVLDPGSHLSVPTSLANVSAAGTGSANATGFVGGGQVGCNWQSGRFVLGIEGDFNAFDANAAFTGIGISTIGPAAVTNSVKTSWLATVRPRAGVAFDRSLLYVTGGVAFADVRYTQTYSDQTPETAFGTSQASQTKTGWTVGAGWEYAFTDNWSAKAEYLYVRFPSMNTTTFVADSPPFTGTNVLHGTATLQANIFRVGLNYRFGWGGPVVAKY
jgi:outer membrane immunogenic protein